MTSSIVGDTEIIACLEADYGLEVREVRRLTLGADVEAAVYRLAAAGGDDYFFKLRRGGFPPGALSVPHWLAERGGMPVVAPLLTRSGELCTRIGAFPAALYPFVDGRCGWEVELSPVQWRQLGACLRALHDAVPPEALLAALPRERYAPMWRDKVRGYLDTLDSEPDSDALVSNGAAPGRCVRPGDGSAARLAALLRRESRVIRDLLARAEASAEALRQDPPPLCLCHGDIHAGNVLVEGERLHVVDWDSLQLAPRERDLMFFGAGVGGVWNREEQEAWFHGGYGHGGETVAIDRTALVHYRFERIVQDIGEICDAVFVAKLSPVESATLVAQCAAQFAPGNVVEMAYATARRVPCLGR